MAIDDSVVREASKAAVGAAVGATTAHFHKQLVLPSHGAGAGAPAAKFAHGVVSSMQGGASVGAAIGAGATAAVGGPATIAAASAAVVAAAPFVAAAAVIGGVGFVLWKVFGDE